MGNTLIAYPDRTMEAATVLSGGSWLAGFPLTNLQNALLKKTTQSTDATAASTQFVATYAGPIDARVIGLLNHNLTLAGTIRVRGYSDAGLTSLVYDTGTQYAWPQTFTAAMVAVWPNNWIWPLPTIATAKYWKCEIVDTAAGAVKIGRFWVGSAFEPEIGISYEGGLGYVSGDVLTTNPRSGVDWGERRYQRRSGVFAFNTLNPAEKRTGLIMQKTLGKIGEIIWVPDKNDIAEDLLLEAFPAKIKDASRIAYPYFGNHEMPFEVLEIV